MRVYMRRAKEAAPDKDHKLEMEVAMLWPTNHHCLKPDASGLGAPFRNYIAVCHSPFPLRLLHFLDRGCSGLFIGHGLWVCEWDWGDGCGI